MPEDDPTFDELLARCGGDPIVRAQTVAFALVTAYDHDVSDLEVGRYVELLREREAPSGALGDAFEELARAMQADLDAATQWARGALKAHRHDDAVVQAAAQAARVAAVADAELAPREEVAMTIVAQALGLIPASM